MKKIAILSVMSSLVGAAFVAGIAVGKATPPAAKFIAAEEVKWDDIGGPKLGGLTGDYKKGPYGALMRLPAGFTSPLHAHTGAYEAIQVSGTSSHWLKGEDGTKAKKMTPGSYWSIPGKVEHVTACAPGQDCVLFIWQKAKFDFLPAKDAPAGSAAATATGSPAKAGAPSGSAAGAASTAKPAGAGTGSAAGKPTGAGAGSTVKPAGAGAGSAAAKPAPTPKPTGGATGSASSPTK